MPDRPEILPLPQDREPTDFERWMHGIPSQAELDRALDAAEGANPDERAEQLRLSRESGLAPPVVDRNRELVDKTLRRRKLRAADLPRRAPETSRWIVEEPTNAQLAHEEIAELSGLEWIFRAGRAALTEGVAQVYLGDVGYRQATGEVDPIEAAYADMLERHFIGRYDYGAEGFWSQNLLEAAKIAPTTTESIRAGGVGAGLGAVAGGTVAALAGIALPFPEELATVPGGMKAGASVLGASGMWNHAYRLELGFAHRHFASLRDENGEPLEREIVQIASLASGVINASLEFGGGLKIVRSFPGLSKLGAPAIRRALGRALQRKPFVEQLRRFASQYAGTIGVETATEIGQEIAPLAVEAITRELHAGEWDRLSLREAREQIQEVAVTTMRGMSLLALPGPVSTFGVEYAHARQAEVNRRRLERVQEHIEKIQLAQRDPDRLAAFVARIAEGGDVDNVYIPIESLEALYQSDEGGTRADADQELAQLVGGDNLATARATGADVVVPIGTYVAKIAPQHGRQLIDQVRLTADGMSVSEAAAWVEDYGGTFSDLVQRHTDQGLEAETAIRGALAEQLVNVGHEPELAEKQAAPLAAFLRVMGERFDIDPLELANRYGIRVVARDEHGEVVATGEAGQAPDAATATEETGAAPAERPDASRDAALDAGAATRTPAEPAPDEAAASQAPTETPTETPTEAPTEAPAERPTETPTEAPAERPTETPDITGSTPTAEPAATPAAEPTATPTPEPTAAPAATAGPARARDGRTAPTETYAFSMRNPETRYPMRYEIVPLDELVTSHDTSGQPRADYPAELQPWNREAASSQEQVREIGTASDYLPMLVEQHSLDRGTPIIGPSDNVVESGNGRTLGLTMARERETGAWDAYQRELAEIAEQMGLEYVPDGVLVRRRAFELADEERVEFTREANGRVSRDPTPVEQAQLDAERIPLELLGKLPSSEAGTIDDALVTKAGEEWTREFLAAYKGQELSRFIDQTGNMGIHGLLNVRLAIFVRTYGKDAGARVLRGILESRGESRRNLERALFGSLARLATLRGRIERGEIEADYDLSGDIAAAVRVYVDLKNRGQRVDDYLRQRQITDERALTPVQETLLTQMEEYRVRGGRLADVWRAYANLALELPHPDQQALFAVHRPDKGELLESALARAEEAWTEKDAKKSGGRQGGGLFQTAYHGSPHRFERFTTDAIGSGEGAQVYGWGLYFAEEFEVASHYYEVLGARAAHNPFRIQGKTGNFHDWRAWLQDTLWDRDPVFWLSREIREMPEFQPYDQVNPSNAESLATQLWHSLHRLVSGMDELAYTREQLDLTRSEPAPNTTLSDFRRQEIARLEAQAAMLPQIATPERISRIAAEAWLEREVRRDQPDFDNLYDALYTPMRVSGVAENIPHRAALEASRTLDVLREIGVETLPSVEDMTSVLRDALQAARAEVQVQRGGQVYEVELASDPASEFLQWDQVEQPPVVEEAIRAFAAYSAERAPAGGATAERYEEFYRGLRGNELYYELVRKFYTPEAASRWLRQHGVRGVRYLDQFSRYGDTSSTSNFVVFDDADVTITRTFFQDAEQPALPLNVRRRPSETSTSTPGPAPWPGADTAIIAEASELASSITPDLLATVPHYARGTLDDALVRPRGRSWLAAWVEAGHGSAGRMTRHLGPDGGMTPHAVVAARLAILVRTFGDRGRPLLAALEQLEGADRRALERALVGAGADLAKLRAALELGHVNRAADVLPDIAAAVQTYAELRASRQRVDDYLSQTSLFGRRLTVDQETLLGWIDSTRRRGARLGEMFSALASEAVAASGETSRAELIDRAAQVVGGGLAPTQASGSRTYFQTAYHGTRHHFASFSTDAIGTGEGMQAFGWGLYFAERRDTAEMYRRALTGTPDRDAGYRVAGIKGGTVSEDRVEELLRTTAFGADITTDLESSLAADAEFQRLLEGYLSIFPNNADYGRRDMARRIARFITDIGTTGGAKILERERQRLAQQERFFASVTPRDEHQEKFARQTLSEGRAMIYGLEHHATPERLTAHFAAQRVLDALRELKTNPDALHELKEEWTTPSVRDDGQLVSPLTRDARVFADTLAEDPVLPSIDPEMVSETALRTLEWAIENVTFGPPGQVYEVELAGDPASEYLTWDSRERSDMVREALQRVAFEVFTVAETTAEQEQEIVRQAARFDDMTGADVYAALRRMLRSGRRASEAMRRHGIRGIRYLDGWSRDYGEGTRNFVVFDDADVEITRTFYQGAGDRADQPELLVQHNISRERIADAEALGGLVVPSLAVSRADAPLTNFGDVTLIGEPDLVDPADGVPVFDADVYSPSFPPQRWSLDAKRLRALQDELAPAAHDLHAIANLDLIEQDLEIDGPRVAESWSRPRRAPLLQGVLRLTFLREQGEDVALVTKPARRRVYFSETAAMRAFVAEHGVEANAKPGTDYWRALSDAAQRAADEFAATHDDIGDTALEALRDGFFDDDGQLHFGRGDELLGDLRAIRDGTVVLDERATEDAILARFDDARNEEYREWLDAKLNPIIGDPFFLSGRRKRAWAAENLLRYMTRALRDSEEIALGGLGRVRSAGARRFRSLGALRKKRAKLAPAEEQQQRHDELNERFFALVEKLKPFHSAGGSIFAGPDALADAIRESYKRGRSLASELKASGFEGLPSELIAEVGELAQELRDATTHYFEAKPQRIVGIDEFRAAVVPSDADPAIRERLDRQGLVVTTYERGDQEARREAIREAAQRAGVLFQPERPPGLPLGDDEVGPGPLADKRGYVSFQQFPSIEIGLLPKANLSTFVHESAHVFLEMFADLAQREDAPEKARADLAALLEWMGVESWADVGVDQHEQFADGVLVYFREGRAPSTNLIGVVERFRAWFLALGRQLLGMRVELTDEVRGVIDRMLASDAEIDEMRRTQGFEPILEDVQLAATLGMDEQQRAEYLEAANKARREARDRLQVEMIRQQMGEREREWQRALSEERPRVARAFAEEPVWRALHYLRTGTMIDGSDVPIGLRGVGDHTPTLEGVEAKPKPKRLDRQALVEEYGDAVLKELPRAVPPIFAKEGGLHPDQIAPFFAFRNGDELVQALRGVGTTFKQAVEAETERRVRERHPDLVVDRRAAADKAIDALENDQQMRVMFREYEAVARSAGGHVAPAKTLKRAAAARVETTPLMGLDPRVYDRAASRSAKAVREALAAHDYELALTKMTQRMLSVFMAREARRVRREADKLQKYLWDVSRGKYAKTLGRAGQDYQDQVDQLLELRDFKRISAKDVRRRIDFRAWIADQDAKGNDVVDIDPRLLDEAEKKNWREMDFRELQSLADNVKNRVHLAARKVKLLIGKQEREFEEVIGELNAQLIRVYKPSVEYADDPHSDAGRDQMGSWIAKVDASLDKLERQVEEMDEGRSDGPWSRYFWNPIADSQGKEDELFLSVITKLVDLFNAIPESRRSLYDKEIMIQSLGQNGQSKTRGYLLTVALNTGNESNFERLVQGNGFTVDQLSEMLSHLDADDWRLVQGIWDLLEELWPKMEAMERRLTGVAPPKVERRAMWPAPIPLEGGYFPVVYDPNRSSAGRRQEEVNTAELFDAGHTRAMTPFGHLIARLKFARPLLLDFNVLPRHLAKAIHDLTHREAVVNAYKILTNDTIWETLVRSVGAPRARSMLFKIKGIANQANLGMVDPDDWIGSMMRQGRANLAVFAIGYRVSTMVLQLAGISWSAAKIGGVWLARGVRAFRERPIQTLEFIKERSAEMKHRFENLDREVKEGRRAMARKRGRLAKGIDPIRENAFQLVAWGDMAVSAPTWYGAFLQYLDEAGVDVSTATQEQEEAAVRHADRAVRLTQGAGGLKDRSDVLLRNDAFHRSITLFHGAFSALYSQGKNLFRDTGDAIRNREIRALPGLLWRALLLFALPAFLEEQMRFREPPEDEYESLYLLRKILMFPLATVPLVRDVAAYLDQGWGVEFSVLATFEQTLERVLRTTWALAEGEISPEETVPVYLEAIALLRGLPYGQAEITADYLHDLMTGEEEIGSLLEVLRNTVYRRPRDE